MKFIDVLLANGYKAYHTGSNLPAKNPYFYSSARQVDNERQCVYYHFHKDGEVDDQSERICFGLNMRNHQPTIIYPCPRTWVYDENGKCVTGTPYDQAMEILLDNEDNQTVLDVITGKRKVREDFAFEFIIDKHQQVKNVTKWE